MESILDILPGRKLFNKIVTCVLDEKFYVDREDHFMVDDDYGYSRFHVYTRAIQIEDRFCNGNSLDISTSTLSLQDFITRY